jgi:hypothetical protein
LRGFLLARIVRAESFVGCEIVARLILGEQLPWGAAINAGSVVAIASAAPSASPATAALAAFLIGLVILTAGTRRLAYILGVPDHARLGLHLLDASALVGSTDLGALTVLAAPPPPPAATLLAPLASFRLAGLDDLLGFFFVDDLVLDRLKVVLRLHQQRRHDAGGPFVPLLDLRATFHHEADAILGRFARHRDREIEAFLQLRKVPALLVEHVESDFRTRADVKMMPGIAQELLLDRPQHLQRERRDRPDLTDAAAMRAGNDGAFQHPGPQSLPGHFHQPEMRDAADLDARAIGTQAILQLPLNARCCGSPPCR